MRLLKLLLHWFGLDTTKDEDRALRWMYVHMGIAYLAFSVRSQSQYASPFVAGVAIRGALVWAKRFLNSNNVSTLRISVDDGSGGGGDEESVVAAPLTPPEPERVEAN